MRISPPLLLPVLSGLLLGQQAPVIGDQAPALIPGRWVKGTPSAPQKGRLTVVAFWATWCGPCRECVPHLTALAQRYKGKVDVIGVNIWERSTDPKTRSEAVDAYVRTMGAQMEYAVAEDTADGRVALAWMGPRGRHGIPRAYVVDQEGRIAWAGHPQSGLDQALEAMLTGTYDMGAARAVEATHELEETVLPVQGRASRFVDHWVVLPPREPGAPYLCAYMFMDPRQGLGLRLGPGLHLKPGGAVAAAANPMKDQMFSLTPQEVPVVRQLPDSCLKPLGLEANPAWAKAFEDPSAPLERTIRRASLFNHYGEPDLALPLLQGIYAKHSGNEGVIFELAYAHNALGQPEQALEVLMGGMMLHAKNRNLHMELGYVNSQLGRFKEAIPCYQRALELSDPEDKAMGDERRSVGEILANLSNCHRQLGDTAQAAAYLKRAKAVAPSDSPIHQVPAL